MSVLALTLLGGIFLYQYTKFNDGKLHIVFCNVGQGDGIFIKTPDNKYILIDGGPDKKVLSCLSSHMPFWERTIDLVLLTHPHADHFLGLYYVIDRYNALSFGTEDLSNKTGSFQELIRSIAEKKIQKRLVSKGAKWTIGKKLVLSIESPTTEFLRSTSPNGLIGESREFASLITHLSYGSFDLLLTGDSQAGELGRVGDRLQGRIDVLQIPHHGSGTGLTQQVLEKINPRLGIISVGSRNRYGHPNKQILSLLGDKNIPIQRTDKAGDIEIVTDGEKWRVVQ